MKFEWDESKNRLNKRKHGIDFSDVAGVFDLPMVTFLDSKKEYGEDRWVGIGWLREVLVVVVFTERGENIVRLISARRALKHEEQIYGNEIGN